MTDGLSNNMAESKKRGTLVNIALDATKQKEFNQKITKTKAKVFWFRIYHV